ncbi:hypothetical protein [Pelagicoccus mobilis]|uniref:Uncharacterized protein n=1 Tax=Pelagicoccus mobilis TaxID=415221 RepID=A0A934RYV2_9BACT|nr:hypothetical protein [Pelagicoccus mobilis]MBK1878863.1 hypothetical protein [Pelagicoccus mobilis]
MKAKRAVETMLFSVAALALSACSDQRQEPTPKTAEPVVYEVRTVEDAKARFAKGIDWDSRPRARATLYTDLLNKNDTVGELVGDSVHHSSEYEWFAFIDYEPGAYFRHPVAHAFLTYEEPKISILPRKHVPTVNYEPAWGNTSELLGDENVFYNKSWLDRLPAKDAEDILADQATNWPPRMMADQCKNEKRAYALLIHNIEDLDTSVETVDNLELMTQALTANGYHVQDFVHDPATGERRPYLDLSSPRGGGIRQLMNFINIHVDFNDCCEELVVYITGETTIEKSGYRESVSLDLPFAYTGTDRSRKPEKKFYPEDLATILDGLKTCHLNFIIDSNNAQGFAGDLLRIPNTESVLTSCQNNEYTYSSAVETLADSFKDPFGVSRGEKGSEFTSSVAKSLFDNAAARIKGERPDQAGNLVKAAYEAVKLYDLGYLAGKSTPALQGRTMDSDCPCGIDTQLTKY